MLQMTRALSISFCVCVLCGCSGDGTPSTDGGQIDAPPALSEDTAALCRDAQDNDSDGFVDCADQDCWELPLCKGDGGSPADSATDALLDAPDQHDGLDPTAEGGLPPDGAPLIQGTMQKPYTSGSRLRARLARSVHGAETFLGWYDNVLHIDCAFALASDGALRCLPSPSINNGVAVYFSDDQCTKPLAFTNSDPCGYPAHARVEDNTACGRPATIYSLGPVRSSSDPVYRRANPTDPCNTVSLASRTQTFDRGAEVPASTFVKGTVATIATTSGVHLLELQADDSAREHWGLHDPANATDCSVKHADDGSPRCLPSPSATAGVYYSDASCTAAVSYFYDPAGCQPPAFALAQDRTTCPYPYAVYGGGAEHQPGVTLYHRADGSCAVVSSPTPGYRYCAVGAARPAADFPLATATDGAIRGRLVEKLHSFGANTAVRTHWYDTQLQHSCTLDRTGDDGSGRCIPLTGVVSVSGQYFRDSNCRDPLIISHLPCSATNYALSVDKSSCPTTYEVYEVGPPHSGPIYIYAGICTVATRPWEITGAKFRRGAKVVAADLVSTSVIVE